MIRLAKLKYFKSFIEVLEERYKVGESVGKTIIIVKRRTGQGLGPKRVVFKENVVHESKKILELAHRRRKMST